MYMVLGIVSIMCMSLNAADTDSPGAFLQRLKEIETKRPVSISFNNLTLSSFHQLSSTFCGSESKNFSDACGLKDYHAYVVALAAANYISPEDKLNPDFADIPPLRNLTDEKEKLVLLACIDRIENEQLYPLVRIPLSLFATNASMMSSINHRQLLKTVVGYDDIPMIQKLLFNSNIDLNAKDHANESPVLSYCVSEEALQILIDKGADPGQLERMLKKQLPKQMQTERDIKSTAFFERLARTVQLNESNSFGNSFMQSVAQIDPSQVQCIPLCSCLKLLLEQHFVCDDDTKEAICKLAGKKSPGTRASAESIFEIYRNSGKNIKG